MAFVTGVVRTHVKSTSVRTIFWQLLWILIGPKRILYLSWDWRWIYNYFIHCVWHYLPVLHNYMHELCFICPFGPQLWVSSLKPQKYNFFLTRYFLLLHENRLRRTQNPFQIGELLNIYMKAVTHLWVTPDISRFTPHKIRQTGHYLRLTAKINSRKMSTWCYSLL